MIVQAAIRSGSLITARLAMESNREVLAVPGPITDSACEGTNHLIRDGATPALEASDILSIFELSESKQEDLVHVPMREDLQIIVAVLTSTPLYIDDIAMASGVPIIETSAALAELEMIGAVTNIGGMRYTKI
mgnify:CR=1 FL=1